MTPLWNNLATPASLLAAAHAAARGKRSRPDVARFLVHLEPAIFQLSRELETASYQPGPYRTFEIQDPKPRQISAAPFRDRVVHHAFTRVAEPIFEPLFSADSYACRKGFGTHRALKAARRAAKRFPFALKGDIRKYFASIDHQILIQLLEKHIPCPRTLALARLIIAHSNPQEAQLSYFPGDTLFTPYERCRGLPLGNQTSQFFANVYLDPLDQFIRQELQPGDYFRYVDDFLLFGDDKSKLAEMRHRIEVFLYDYRVNLHPGKTRDYRTQDGVTFLGWRLFPDRSRLVRPNVQRFRARMRALQRDYNAGCLDWDDVNSVVQSWIAHAAHGDTWRLRQQLFHQFSFFTPHRPVDPTPAAKKISPGTSSLDPPGPDPNEGLRE